MAAFPAFRAIFVTKTRSFPRLPGRPIPTDRSMLDRFWNHLCMRYLLFLLQNSALAFRSLDTRPAADLPSDAHGRTVDPRCIRSTHSLLARPSIYRTMT